MNPPPRVTKIGARYELNGTSTTATFAPQTTKETP